MDEQTHDNLITALHGEAFAYARYRLFAAQAREEGDLDLAEMLEGLAAVELNEHFAELAELAGLVGGDLENLELALRDENLEVEETYPSFANQARAAGELAAAERFDEIRADELEHARTLETALERLVVPV
ncbi:MAG TPA: ferritin family protein [Gaiellaceae bacterium]|nr:ferritin family protein [Gaiellaceae bacterium]